MANIDTLLTAAKRSHPAFRFATAVAGLGALVVIFVRFGVNLATVTFGVIVLICLMTLFVLFTGIATLSRAVLRLPALVMLWFVFIVVAATVLLLFTSAFFDVPLPLRARLLSSTQDAKSASSVAMPNRVRMALVAANWNYPGSQLTGPESDMMLVARALRKVGFRVRELPNATHSDFMTAWREVETVGRYGGVALLYYSGHGTRQDGHDYIIPMPETSASPLASASLHTNPPQYSLAGVELIQGSVPAPADAPKLIDVSSLLAAIKPLDSDIQGASGDLALYSTSPGGLAVDVGPDGRHSPFAVAFADAVTTEGGDVRAVLDRVASKTRELTDGRQVPWFAGTFVGSFTFTDRSRDNDLAVLRMIVFDAARPEASLR